MSLEPSHRSNGPVVTPYVNITPFADKGPQDATSGVSYSVGAQLFDPSLYAGGGGHSIADGIVAFNGGGRANATPVLASINRVSTARAAGDSISLPASAGGQIVVVLNGTNSAIQVFARPGTTDTINGVAADTGVLLAVAKAAMFCSARPGAWFWILSA